MAQSEPSIVIHQDIVNIRALWCLFSMAHKCTFNAHVAMHSMATLCSGAQHLKNCAIHTLSDLVCWQPSAITQFKLTQNAAQQAGKI